MISANELRIGNWVNNFGNPLQIKPEDLHILSCDLPAILREAEDYYVPIPLTPEILEKAGFEKVEPVGWYRLRGKFKSEDFELFDGNPFHWASGINFSPDVPYVHQLQNLYFALTGEELNIEL